MAYGFKLSTKITVIGVVAVIASAMALVWLSFHMEKKIYREKQLAAKHVVEIVHSLLIEYQERFNRGELTMDDAQRRATLTVKNLRYEGKEYFWINDLGPKMIMHPYKPELDGKDLSDFKDPKGKHLFVEFVKTCKEKGEGAVAYLWPKAGNDQPVDKISYVKLFEPWGWVVGSGFYLDAVQEEIVQVRYLLSGITLVLGLSVVLFSVCMARSLSRPIYHVVEGLQAASDQLGSASSQILSASEQLAQGASEQAASLEESSSSLEEIASMTRQNAQNAGHADQLMVEGDKVVEQANRSMTDLIASMAEISKTSEETQKIIKTIDEIAFQTNLLALNAAVEAARAGETGAGFAVVADEVRNLAMRAAEAAKNTASLIEGTVKRIREGSLLLDKTNQDFRKVAETVTKSCGLVGEIAAATREQAQGIDQVNRSVAEMSKVTQQNAANAEESAAASEEMDAQAEQLKGFTTRLVVLVAGTGGNDKDKKREMKPADEMRKPSIVHAITASRRSSEPIKVIRAKNNGADKIEKTDTKNLLPERYRPLERDF